MLDYNEVIAFLDLHPDFLQQHADRLARPATGDRVVISLADRQILELRDRIRQLEARLQQLIRHGENNDLLQQRLHALTLFLADCRTINILHDGLAPCLANIFGLQRTALRLWHPEAGPLHASVSPEIIKHAQGLLNPGCGPYVNDEILSWFPAEPVLQSFSQLALLDSRGEAIGLLVLASDDSARFSTDMHTHYLKQIGEVLSHTLVRLLDAP